MVRATNVGFRLCVYRWNEDAAWVMSPQQWSRIWLAETRATAAASKVRAAVWADGTPRMPKVWARGVNTFIVALTACLELSSSLVES